MKSSCWGLLLALVMVTQLSGYTQQLRVTSPDFDHEGEIPRKFTCDGDDTNPTLEIAGLPAGTRSLVLIVEDPDVPSATFSHWVVWNIEPLNVIKAGTAPGVQGANSMGKSYYIGPCPPAGSHRYFFKVFAIDTMLELGTDSNKRMVEEAMTGHVLATGEIMARYRRQ